MLIISSLLLALFIYLFLTIFKTTPEVNTGLKLTLIHVIYGYIFITSINNIVFYPKHILLLHGDMKLNPGLIKLSFIKFCHCDMNGLLALHDFIKYE